MVMLSAWLVLSMRTVKVTVPPGSCTKVGFAVFITCIDAGKSVMSTLASSEALTGSPSSSTPVAVTVSISKSPALPEILALKTHC